MTQNCNPGKCLSDLERRPSKTLAWLIDALALAVGMLAVFYYKPEGMVAGIIVFVGAYTLTHSLQGLNWEFLGSISGILLGGLGFAIHLCTLLTAPASFTGLVFTFLLPGIAEAYWIWAKWATMGTLSHPVTLMCVAWLALLGSAILARYMVGNGRAPQSN
jgi:hypothetical protein